MRNNHEHTPNRFPARVGVCAAKAAREREGADPRPRRARRRASANALAGRGEGVPVPRPPRKSEPARPLRRAPSVDRVPRVLRTGRARLARAWLRRLLLDGRPGGPRRPSERPRHHARLRLARATSGHPAPEGADGLEDAVVHDDGRLRRRLRRRRVARHERVLPRRRPRVSHVLPQQPRRRGAWEHLELPRYECARAPGGVGGLSGGLPPDAAVRVVDLARRSTPDGSQLTLPAWLGIPAARHLALKSHLIKSRRFLLKLNG